LSPQTLFCILLLTFVLTNQRAPYGFHALLITKGIGGQFARVMLPVSIGTSFLIILMGERLLSTGLLSLPYAAAVTSSCMASLLGIIVILLARKINTLEEALHKLSNTDELTELYNRRGFYLLGEQALRDAYRNQRPLVLLFFDLDGLKQVNDGLGHEAGSQLIHDMAQLLHNCFRKSDILGRIGGDEFAVIALGKPQEVGTVLERLSNATNAMNREHGKAYQISYSAGIVEVDLHAAQSLDELLEQADAAMYRKKREKRAVTDIPVTANQPPSNGFNCLEPR